MFSMRLKFLFALFLCAIFAAAQDVPDMASAPHYRLLLSNDQVRVFSVDLRTNERTMARHDHNFLVITLQDCEVIMWPEGASDITNFRFSKGDVRFGIGGRASGIRNEDTVEYRNVTVEFLNPNVTNYGYQTTTGTWDYGASGVNPPLDPHGNFRSVLRLGDAIVNDFQLLSRDPLPLPEEKDGPELLIPVTDVDLKSSEYERIRKSSGDVVWIPPGRKSTPTSASTSPARLVLINFKAASADQTQ
jgi:hypothetical protein